MIEISKNLELAKKILEQDDIVAIPTETVYGLAANIYSEKAVLKIFETKKRPFNNPLIVHTHSIDELHKFVSEIPKKALALAIAFWPGSLTLVLKKKDSIPDLITAGKDTVGIRIPNHPLTLELLKMLDFPLAAPSANPFTSISPTSAKHVKSYFESEIKLVLDGGNCTNGIESTIVGFENNEPIIYRLGSISQEEIEQVVGKVSIKNKAENEAIIAPGMMSRHYAPKTKIILVDAIYDVIADYKNFKIGIISLNETVSNSENCVTEILSTKSNLKEATANLYAAMHRLDKLKLDIIICQKFPENDLGKSINDRLQRATKN